VRGEYVPPHRYGDFYIYINIQVIVGTTIVRYSYPGSAKGNRFDFSAFRKIPYYGVD
jgi:hypothetical protein